MQGHFKLSGSTKEQGVDKHTTIIIILTNGLTRPYLFSASSSRSTHGYHLDFIGLVSEAINYRPSTQKTMTLYYFDPFSQSYTISAIVLVLGDHIDNYYLRWVMLYDLSRRRGLHWQRADKRFTNGTRLDSHPSSQRNRTIRNRNEDKSVLFVDIQPNCYIYFTWLAACESKGTYLDGRESQTFI